MFSSSFLAGIQIDISGTESGEDFSDERAEKPILFLRSTTDVNKRNTSENDVSQKRVKGSINRQPDYVIMHFNIVICYSATIL